MPTMALTEQCLCVLPVPTPKTCWYVNRLMSKLALVCICMNMSYGPPIESFLRARTDVKVQHICEALSKLMVLYTVSTCNKTNKFQNQMLKAEKFRNTFKQHLSSH